MVSLTGMSRGQTVVLIAIGMVVVFFGLRWLADNPNNAARALWDDELNIPESARAIHEPGIDISGVEATYVVPTGQIESILPGSETDENDRFEQSYRLEMVSRGYDCSLNVWVNSYQRVEYLAHLFTSDEQHDLMSGDAKVVDLYVVCYEPDQLVPPSSTTAPP